MGKPFHFKARFPIRHATKKKKAATIQPPEKKLPGVVIHIINIPLSRSERQLKTLFETVGKVLAIEFLPDNAGKRSESVKIAFSNEDDAISAYFKFDGSFVGHEQPMKIRFMDSNLQVPADHGDLPGSFSEPQYYFKD